MFGSVNVGGYNVNPLSLTVTKERYSDKYSTDPPSIASNLEDFALFNQFNLQGNSQLEKWGALARTQALGAGYGGAAAAQAEMRAKNRGWLSLAEQADEWARRMAELAYTRKAQAAGIDTTTGEAAAGAGIMQSLSG